MKRLLLFSLVAMVGSRAAADPLDAKSVAAGAKWVIHVDVDAAHDAKVLQKVHEHMMKQEKAKKHLEDMQRDLGLDPRKDLHAITLYGSSFEPHSGVAIIRAAVDQDKVKAHLKGKADFKAGKVGDRDLYTWTERKGKKHEHTVNLAFQKADVAVVAHKDAEVKAALEVLDAKGETLAKDSPLSAEIEKGTILTFRGTGMSSAKPPIKVPVLSDSERLSVAIGERDGNSFGHGTLVTKNGETAGQVRSLVEGFKAMVQLRANEEIGQRMIKGLKVGGTGDTVTADWTASADDVLSVLQKMHERHEKHRAKGDKRGGDKGDKGGEVQHGKGHHDGYAGHHRGGAHHRGHGHRHHRDYAQHDGKRGHPGDAGHGDHGCRHGREHGREYGDADWGGRGHHGHGPQHDFAHRGEHGRRDCQYGYAHHGFGGRDGGPHCGWGGRGGPGRDHGYAQHGFGGGDYGPGRHHFSSYQRGRGGDHGKAGPGDGYGHGKGHGHGHGKGHHGHGHAKGHDGNGDDDAKGTGDAKGSSDAKDDSKDKDGARQGDANVQDPKAIKTPSSLKRSNVV